MNEKTTFLTSSRRNTPWTSRRNDATPLEAFIDDTAERNYTAKHPLVRESKEDRLLNSYKPSCCPHCSSEIIVKSGRSSTGVNRYKCNKCGRRFNILTGTIFQDHKIPISEWVAFCMNLISYQSFTSISHINLNSYTTTRYWISKIFLLLRNWQNDIILEDKVYIDETYYTVRKSDIERKPDGTNYRGLSKNQMCIGIGCDSNGHVLALLEGFGKTSREKTLRCFNGHIKEKSHLIHDEEKAHKVLVSKYELTEEVHNSRLLKRLSDEENPLNPINQECNQLKRFLHNHRSFIREDMADYLNLFVFIRDRKMSKYEKIEYLLDKAICTRETLKYRDEYQ